MKMNDNGYANQLGNENTTEKLEKYLEKIKRQ